MLQVVRKIAEKYGALSLSIRFLILALAGVVSGSSYIGVLSEYGAHHYAIQHGFRPPVEGVPFLRATVTTTSFLLLLACAAGSFAVLLLGKYTIGCFELITRLTGKLAPQLTLRWLRQQPVVSRVLSTLFGTTALTIGIARSTPPLLESAYGVSGIHLQEIHYATIALGVLAMYGLMLWPRALRWYVLASVIVLVTSPPFLFFNAKLYGKLLRRIAFGGGMPVHVTLTEGSPSTEVDTHLLMRTASALVIYDQSSDQVGEIPLGNVILLTHEPSNRVGTWLVPPPLGN